MRPRRRTRTLATSKGLRRRPEVRPASVEHVAPELTRADRGRSAEEAPARSEPSLASNRFHDSGLRPYNGGPPESLPGQMPPARRKVEGLDRAVKAADPNLDGTHGVVFGLLIILMGVPIWAARAWGQRSIYNGAIGPSILGLDQTSEMEA